MNAAAITQTVRLETGAQAIITEADTVYRDSVFWWDTCEATSDPPPGSVAMTGATQHEIMHVLGVSHRFHPCFRKASMMYYKYDVPPGNCFTRTWDDFKRQEIQYPFNSAGPYPSSIWAD